MRSLALIAVLAAAPAARADEPVPEKAKKLAERGRELHTQGDYARAIAAFKEAYVMAPSPGLLFNLAQAYRLQGNCDDSALMYRRYIATNPPPDGKALAEAHLATVERCVHKRSLDIPMDESARYLQAPPPPTAAEQLLVASPAPAPHRSVVKTVGVAATIGGAAALAGAGYFAYRAYAASNDVERMYAMGARWQDIAPIHERGQSAERAALWLGIGGGLAAATGVTLYVLGHRSERAVPVAVTPKLGGAEVSYAWTF